MANRVLITQGTRPFAQRVGKLLHTRYAVQFGSAEEIPQVLVETGNYIQLPGVGTPAFEHEILRDCLDNGTDVLIPLGEAEIYSLVGARQLFAEYGIAVWLPDAVRMDGLDVIKNPKRHFPLVVLDHGVTVAGENSGAPANSLSGIFTRPTPTDDLALCCIAD